MNILSLFPLSLRLAVASGLFFVLWVPPPVSAASVLIGSIDVSSLAATSSKPTLSGLAFGAENVQVIVRKEGSTKIVFKSKIIPVQGYRWNMKISKTISDGIYDVELWNMKGGTFINAPSGVLTVGVRPVSPPTSMTTLVVGPIPLLAGGLARAGTAIPVSYLQITNIGKEQAFLKGFWVKQNGSASTRSIIGLSTVDDKGGSRGVTGGTEGSTPFKNGLAFAPTEALFAPGQMRLFTIKSVLTNNVTSYLGTQLKIDVTAIETDASVQGTFPIRGTTWLISN